MAAANHRPEIDGLRAIAVISVLLNHAGVLFVPGGFLGVDIFFVISGYLITGNILKSLAAGTFSLADFYERRIRRILPALFVVMLITIIPALIYMGDDALKNFGQSLVATTFWANNILLTITSGYWDTESSFKPLLHTWSLGVEEQYYVVVPLLLWAASRVGHDRARSALWLIAIVSFIITEFTINSHPVAAFYNLHTRAWELAAGGIAWSSSPNQREVTSDLAGLGGLILIIGSLLLVPFGTATPSWLCLPIVAGSAQVLVYARSGLSYRLLSNPIARWLGLLSYSIYLWHQPLYALLRVASPDAPPLWQFLGMGLISIGLAYLTWRWIENPFRNRNFISFRRASVIILAMAAVSAGLGALFVKTAGLPSRFERAAGEGKPGAYKAYNESVFAFKADRFPDRPGTPVLIIGNSQGRDFVNMLRETGQIAALNVVYRDDLHPCEMVRPGAALPPAVGEAQLIVLVYDWTYHKECSGYGLANTRLLAGRTIFIGPRNFGDNVNPFVRLPLAQRPGVTVRMSPSTLEAVAYDRSITPPALYVDAAKDLSKDGQHVPIFDAAGRILSEDRLHLTRAGAAYVGRFVLRDPIWKAAIARASASYHLSH